MARHNDLRVIAVVRTQPKVKSTIDGKAAVVGVTTIMSNRDYAKATTGYQKSSVTFAIKSREKNIVEIMETLEINDVIDITGFIATKEIEKQAECPHCGFVNRRIEACVHNNQEKSGGNSVFVYPLSIRLLKKCQTEQEAFLYLHQDREVVNKVTVLGNVTSAPKQGFLQEGTKIYTRFQIAINRKYCPKGGNELYDRTDYPWIYSYGDKAIEDFKNIEKGALVLVDGALQSRKYKETYICGECNEAYEVPGNTLEILAYDTEYLRLPTPITKEDKAKLADNDSISDDFKIS